MTGTGTDDDLERLLRSTLTARGATVTDGPDWRGSDTDAAVGAPRRRRLLAPIAAAAAAAVVAGVIAANSQSHEDRTPPRPAASSVTNAPPPTPTLGTDISRAVCSIPLPAAWQNAIDTGTSTGDSDAVEPLAGYPDGRVVVRRDLGTIRDVALLGADGHAESVYTLPSHADEATAAQVENRSILIPVAKTIREHGEPVSTIVELVVVTDHTTLQFRGDRPGFVDGAALLNGHVYFDLRPKFDSDHGQIYDVDLSNFMQHSRTTVFTGAVAAPVLFGAGISWDKGYHRIAVPRPVPAPVAAQTRSQPIGRDEVVTDGSSWAWADGATGVAWYRTGQPGPVHFDLGGNASVLTVAGDYLVYQRGGTDTRILDVRTGAEASLPSIEGRLVSAAGVLALAGYDNQSQPVVMRVDTRRLPGLTC